jgi:hypothetical protein
MLQGERLRKLLTKGAEMHAAEASLAEENRKGKRSAEEAKQKKIPSLHAWLGPQLLGASTTAAAAALTLCDDLPSALQGR